MNKLSKIRLPALAVVFIALQGCSYDDISALTTPDFGNAVSANIAAQTVNPMAPMDRSVPLSMEGQRAALQQQRYTTDMVEQPMDVGTLSGASGGGGGGGGGAGAGVGAGPVR
jgi:hypothetical protein